MITATNLAKCRREAGAICCQCAGLIRFQERQVSTDHGKRWMHLQCFQKLRDGDWADAYPPPPPEIVAARNAEQGLAFLRAAGKRID